MANYIARSIAVSVTSLGLLLPTLGLAQQDTPSARPEYTDAQASAQQDQALRDRVNEFFQYHVDGTYRQAMDMVAEETKDEYFAEGKMKVMAFQIDSIQYSDDLEEALVTLDVARKFGFHGQESDVTLPMVTTWKIENGLWVWYHDQGRDSITPMALSNRETIAENPLISENLDGTLNMPKDFSDETLLAAFEAIMKKTNVDKTEISLSRTEKSEDTFVLHNGSGGFIGLEIGGAPEMPGVTVSIDRTSLQNEEDATITVRYDPPTDPEAKLFQLPDSFGINVVTVPLNQRFNLTVQFQ